MQLLKSAAFIASLAAVASAQLRVIRPSASEWWVAQSNNVLEWDCKASTQESFTVLIANENPAILPQPLAIIAIQNNFDCSIVITQDQANQAAGTGYRILLANIVNGTDVYATSEPFEIKPLGSLYPSQQASADASRSASASGAASSGGANDDDGAAAVSRPAMGLVAATFGVVGAAFAGLF